MPPDSNLVTVAAGICRLVAVVKGATAVLPKEAKSFEPTPRPEEKLRQLVAPAVTKGLKLVTVYKLGTE